MGSTRKVAGVASSSSSHSQSLAGKHSRAAAAQIQLNKTRGTLKTKPLSTKRAANVTRRSQRILNFRSVKPTGKQQVCVLDDDTSSEAEVVELLQSVDIQLHTSEAVDAQKNKGGRGRTVKKTGTTVNKSLEINNAVAADPTEQVKQVNDAVFAAPTEQAKQVNDADATQQVVNNDTVPAVVNIAGESQEQDVERSPSPKISDTNTRYKTLYRKAMRRLEAVTEERNVLSRQLAVAETKIGVLNDFTDQLNEVNKRLDITNERLLEYQKTMNPQVVDLQREVPTKPTTQSQNAAVPRNISSSKDAGLDKVNKPLTRSSKKRKCHATN